MQNEYRPCGLLKVVMNAPGYIGGPDIHINVATVVIILESDIKVETNFGQFLIAPFSPENRSETNYYTVKLLGLQLQTESISFTIFQYSNSVNDF